MDYMLYYDSRHAPGYFITGDGTADDAGGTHKIKDATVFKTKREIRPLVAELARRYRADVSQFHILKEVG